MSAIIRDIFSPPPRLSPAPAPEKKRRRRETKKEAVDILARTLYGEARGEGVSGLEAVASVVMNRLTIADKKAAQGARHWWGNDAGEICGRPFQFSCWNEGDPNRAVIAALQPGDKLFDCCRRIARRAVNGVLEDKTRGATHYHAQGVFPSWARGKAPSVEIGHHLFYNDIE
ncbi:MAG: cell wall hydrolase [Rhodospirillaceae bacterium]|jgi:N-acetylmuramoyl-L-alanine amidase|nr:cell wall hydrolase [Rhodospirillaceae bacterium]MBT5373854.1 cell wall hydrolase [Rhodospirillaceae bacterium]MBT5752850.1 cell wall hydrolase [Rhodospirillaceae bacterium]